MKQLKVHSATWDIVWSRLVLAFGDAECQCKETGEVWRYMGTVIKGEKAEHQFRNCSLNPENGQYAYWYTMTDIISGDYESYNSVSLWN